MRLSKPLLTRRKDLILLISLLLFSHVGAIGSLTSNAVVPISVSNKSELVVPMNHQHSLEKVQGNIQVKTPSKYTGVEANYKATPLNIHIESARSSSTGSAQTSPSVAYSATAHANAGGGAFATTKHIAPKKTKTINQTHTALSQVGAAQPVIMRAADSDDDDDWNPGGTGGFDNPGEPPVIPVPVGGGILPLILMAIAYALKQNRKK